MSTDQAAPSNTVGDAATPPASPDFSLVLGGPLYQLLRRSHLTDDALRMQRRRVVVISLVAWLPLLVLSAAGGRLLGGGTAVPFLHDLEVHIRFLVVMPLLIAAELIVHQRMRNVTRAFRERRLVPDEATVRLDAAVASAYRLRNSVFGELLLIAVVYFVGIVFIWRNYVALETSSWYAMPTAGGYSLTAAGAWLVFVSLPLLQFLLCRWYFRIFIWGRLLWQVSRIKLNLVPTHPDRVGGLGFLSMTVYAFVPLLMAHGALLAGQIANRIFFLGGSLPQFKLEILLLVILVLFLVVAPLLVFVPQLAEVKRTGLREYGTLAQSYVREFDRKWLRGAAPPDEPLLGSSDIQSLADLGNSLEVVRGMRMVPITKEAIAQLAFATVAPIVPLSLTMMPLEDLLKKLVGIIF